MLLQWCTLEPTGPDSLAAIRFSKAVRIQSIRIFPTDAQPFAQNPEIRSRTAPETFFLNIYFNAMHTHEKERLKATNALVPTMIAYTGGQVDFSVNMGSEFATRLMIVRGSFQSVSMAIYGDFASETTTFPELYKPLPLPSFEPPALSSALDPANTLDPTQLAMQLLSLIPDAPPLPLVIRLMFCLKPREEDWDLPDFPYLHPALDGDSIGFDLDKACRLSSQAMADNISEESLIHFAQHVTQAVDPKKDDHAYLVAEILSNAASQHQDMAKRLLQKLDLTTIFEGPKLRKPTLRRLLYATTNADIARHLNIDWFLETVDSIAKNSQIDLETRLAANKLVARIQGWETLEDALVNTQGDFSNASKMIAEVGRDEESLGVWLESMVTHHDIMANMSEIPVLSNSLPLPRLLLQSNSSTSHDEFTKFLRAFIGVSCVLAVYAWTDSLPHERCREKTLGILRLWQSVDGYREIVDHLLLLRQMTFRLGCMMDNEVPTRSGDDAEHILVNLSKTPRTFLSLNLADCILSLKSPHSFITDEELMFMQQAATIAKNGLLGAVDELVRPIESPVTSSSLRNLRVALAIVEQDLQDRREWVVLGDFWEEGACSMVIRLVEVFLLTTEEIESHFSLKPLTFKSQDLMSQLFLLSNELLRLLHPLIPAYPLPSRVIRSLTIKIADLFTCTDAAESLYRESSPACVAAQMARQSCIDIICVLADTSLEGGKLGLEMVLRSLLQHGLRSEERDPAHHLLQVFWLIDILLPLPDSEKGPVSSMQRVVPNLLHDLWAFCRALDTDSKAHFVRRLVDLDRGVIGIGDWLLLEELKEIIQVTYSLEDTSLTVSQQLVKRYRISLSLRFLLELVRTSGVSRWCIDCLTTEDEAVHIFTAFLTSLLDQHFLSSPLTELVAILTSESSPTQHDLCNVLVLVLLRSARSTDISTDMRNRLLHLSSTILSSTTFEMEDEDRLRSEFGELFATLSEASSALEGSTAETLVSLMEWLSAAAASGLPELTKLRGISSSTLSMFCDLLREAIPSDLQDRLANAKDKISVAEEMTSVTPLIPLPESLQLSMHDLEDLLRLDVPTPSTPPRNALNQDVLGLVTVSPIALIRSQASTGLTKTYVNNDFRQLRQMPSARQNTSRLPSMHVDVGVAMVA
ncbi:hypothetical protein BKA93DRAFT_287049 [Sparassis latifolia]